MYIAKVAGTVVCTRKVDGLAAFKLLLVKRLDLERNPTGEFTIAVDVVGAGMGEIVLVVTGSSARQTDRTDKKPVDAAVIGIIDTVTVDTDEPARTATAAVAPAAAAPVSGAGGGGAGGGAAAGSKGAKGR